MKIADAKHLVRQRLIAENELPEIPSGWTVERLRFVFSESKERNGKEPVGEMLSVSEYNGVTPKEYDGEERKRANDEIETYRVVRPGQLAVNSMWLNHLGLGVSDHLGYVSPAYEVYDISDRLDARFVHHLMRSQFYLRIYTRYLYGIRPNSFQIKAHDWANIPVIVPDLASQKRIADFLDSETARIDGLIEKKLGLLSATERLRSTSIDRAISGEHVDASRTDTGNTWFPTIPAGWRLARLKHLVNSISDGPHISPDYVDSGVPFISARNIKVDRWSLEDAKFISEKLFKDLSRKTQPKNGDVLYTKVGTTGVARYVDLDFDFQIWVHVALLKVRLSVAVPQFVATALNSLGCYEQSQLFTRGATNNDLGLNRMANICLPLPPIEEQIKIVERLTQTFEKIDRLRAKLDLSITRLREYRSALITAAVTGQIDIAALARPVEIAPRRAVAEVVPLHPNPPPTTLPDRRTVRVLVAADVVHRLGAQPSLGRIKLQKLMFLAEVHANINEIGGRYERYRAGPYDCAMMPEIEAGLRQEQFYDAKQDAAADRGRITFQRMPRAGDHHNVLSAALGDKVASLRTMVDLFKDMNTEATEAVATLYAVWNDALIDGQQPDDAAIIRGFLQEWHKDKDKFRQADLQTWLGWMRRKCIVPRGAGPRTISTSTPSLFEGE